MIDDNTEDDILEKSKSRAIIQTILDYGIKNHQIYDMICFLAMELENINHMRDIVSLIKSLQEPSQSPIITKE